MRIMNLFWPLALIAPLAVAQESHQATGVKVGEVTHESAIVWMRLTANSQRKADGIVFQRQPVKALSADLDVNELEGSCPGAPGRVRLRYGPAKDLANAKTMDWVEVTAETDFTHHFRLTGLKPNTVYYYSAETATTDSIEHKALLGRFKTAPPPDVRTKATFIVITGQMYQDLDHPDGFNIYQAMPKLEPSFIVPTGDTVYYDNENPRAITIAVARYHWQRMYSMPRLVAFHLQTPGYWEKDDHDTVFDDCWPSRNHEKMLPMTFKDGQRIFLEQVPMSEKTYRTFRWGKGVQIWLVEGRDYRSSNKMPDGPEKTIWGPEQKRWLKQTLLASDADFKILISPTPIVGPDRTKKADNHANAAFAHEGNEFRQWIQEKLPHNFFIACGDRHWQYHSVHPETGIHEFSCGPVSDQHAGGSPGENPQYHRFHRVKGGFLSVTVTPSANSNNIAFRFHDVTGKVIYEYRQEKK